MMVFQQNELISSSSYDWDKGIQGRIWSTYHTECGTGTGTLQCIGTGAFEVSARWDRTENPTNLC